MRFALTCAATLAAFNLAAALAPVHAAQPYKLAPQSRALKYGAYDPVALTDYGLAAGTLSYYSGGSSAYFSESKFFSDDAFCTILGAGNTTLTGISRDSQLTYTVGNCPSASYGYVYNQTANTTTAVQYPNGAATNVTGVSLAGEVVGYWTMNSTAIHGFFLSGGVYSSFDVTGATATVPEGISAQSTIFGAYEDGNNVIHGFLLAHTGAQTTITYPGAGATYVTGLDGGGLASGTYSDSQGYAHAFAWQNGTFLQPHLPKAIASATAGVNENGDIAGTYEDAAGVLHGFVWNTATSKVIVINAPKGITTLYINALNNTQAAVTGTYYNKAGKQVGFIATCAGATCFP